jgi:mannosyltransferase OCH1-like enzyme
MQSWRTLNPQFEYERFDHRTALQFLESNHRSGVASAYKRLREPAQCADLFRLAYLSVRGGLYVDADDRCLTTIDTFAPRTATFLSYYEEYGTIANNFLGAMAQHPVIARALQLATQAVNRGDGDLLWLSTGPGVLTRAFAQILAETNPYTAALEHVALLDVNCLRRSVGLHSPAGYKRTRRHWHRSSFGLARHLAEVSVLRPARIEHLQHPDISP